MWKVRCFVVMLVSLVGGAHVYSQSVAPEAAAFATDAPPVVDGVLDDPGWARAQIISNFVVFARGPIGEVNNDTLVRLMHDGRWLYVGAVCHNPDMRHLEAASRVNGENTIWMDDALEVCLVRDGQAGHAFIVNFVGLQADRGIRGGAGMGWNRPWIAAATAQDDGWTVEMAIPLFLFNATNPAPIKLNMIRNRVVVEKDYMGAKMGERKMTLAWSMRQPDWSVLANDSTAFGIIAGMDDLRAESVFLPRVTGLAFNDYEIGKQACTLWRVEMRGMTDVPGRVRLKFNHADDAADVVEENEYVIEPRGRREEIIRLPVKSAGGGHTELKLVDVASGGILQIVPMPAPNRLIADVVSDRNYYTTEDVARMRCRLSLRDFAGYKLAAVDEHGVEWAQTTNLGAVTELAIPCKGLDPGENKFILSLIAPDDTVMERNEYGVLRMAPRPGHEIKVDHFRRVPLRNGEPFFIFGMWMSMDLQGGHLQSDSEEGSQAFRLLADTGFNTVLRSYFRLYRTNFMHFKTREFMDRAREHNLMVIDSFHDLLGVEHAEDHQYRRRYDEYMAAYTGDFDLIHTYTNLIGYYNLDEPNLGNWRLRMDRVCRWYYRDMKQLDPYRPVFGLFACNVPRLDEALAPFDIIGYNPYVYPGWRDYGRGDINFVARKTFELERMLAPLRKPHWTLPAGTTLDANRSPLGLSYQEQLNQVYQALIYGAKGVLYFARPFIWGRHTWAAFRTLRAHLDVLEPAILAEKPDVELAYESGDVDLSRGALPLVHLAFLRYPGGRYVLLAANGRDFPVDVRVRVPGLQSARRLFGDVPDAGGRTEAWEDRIEPLGVRAVEIIMASDTPLNRVAVREIGHAESCPPAIILEDVIARVSVRRNKMPNPIFDMDNKIEGVPNFYLPYFVQAAERIGDPAHEYWALDENNPKFGRYCMRLSLPAGVPYRNALSCVAYLPVNLEYPRDFTFSIHMRSVIGGEQLRLGIFGNNATFALTPEWRRYSMKVHIKAPPLRGRAGFIISPPAGGAVWVDGLQFEDGDTLTDFTVE